MWFCEGHEGNWKDGSTMSDWRHKKWMCVAQTDTFIRTPCHTLSCCRRGPKLFTFLFLFFFLPLPTNTSARQQSHRSSKTTVQDSVGALYVTCIYYNPGTLQGKEMRRLWNVFKKKGDIKTESRNVQNSEGGKKAVKTEWDTETS